MNPEICDEAGWREMNLITVGLFALGIFAERYGRDASGWCGMVGFILLAIAIQVDTRLNRTTKVAAGFSFSKFAGVVLSAIGLALLVVSVVKWASI